MFAEQVHTVNVVRIAIIQHNVQFHTPYFISLFHLSVFLETVRKTQIASMFIHLFESCGTCQESSILDG